LQEKSEELTYKSYGSGNIWFADLPAYAILITNPVDQLNGYTRSTKGIYVRHSFPLVTFFPVTKPENETCQEKHSRNPSSISHNSLFSYLADCTANSATNNQVIATSFKLLAYSENSA